MTKLVAIHRHPVKGFTAEALTETKLQAGGGLPFDRHFAFVSGNKEDVPVPGQWVQPRTFLMLTLYPELARFDCKLTHDGTTLQITGPDGETVRATAGAPDTFDAANAILSKHFEHGPHSDIRLTEQANARGNWDFSDTEISIINLASLRVISQAVGRDLEKERFRGNLYIDGLEPWEEFSWPGCRIKVGEAELDVLRPVQRCAMTSTEPGTGLREVDVPKSMTDAFGHHFCGVYAKVREGGRIATNDKIRVVEQGVLDPDKNLPARAADPATWPRFVNVASSANGVAILKSDSDGWAIGPAQDGQKARVHATTLEAPTQRIPIASTAEGDWEVSPDHELYGRVLISGPYGRAN